MCIYACVSLSFCLCCRLSPGGCRGYIHYVSIHARIISSVNIYHAYLCIYIFLPSFLQDTFSKKMWIFREHGDVATKHGICSNMAFVEPNVWKPTLVSLLKTPVMCQSRDMRHATCDMRHATCDMRHAFAQRSCVVSTRRPSLFHKATCLCGLFSFPQRGLTIEAYMWWLVSFHTATSSPFHNETLSFPPKGSLYPQRDCLFSTKRPSLFHKETLSMPPCVSLCGLVFELMQRARWQATESLLSLRRIMQDLYLFCKYAHWYLFWKYAHWYLFRKDTDLFVYQQYIHVYLCHLCLVCVHASWQRYVCVHPSVSFDVSMYVSTCVHLYVCVYVCASRPICVSIYVHVHTLFKPSRTCERAHAHVCTSVYPSTPTLSV